MLASQDDSSAYHHLCPARQHRREALQMRRGRVLQTLRLPKASPLVGNRRATQTEAGTRSWAEAEQVKRDLEDQLARWKSEPRTDARDLQGSIEVFIEDKKFQGVAAGVVAKYSLQPRRLREFCEASGVFTVQGVSRELITGFCATWETLYPSGITLAKQPEKLRSFLRYCYDARWPERIPAVPKFKLDDVETQPLTPCTGQLTASRAAWICSQRSMRSFKRCGERD